MSEDHADGREDLEVAEGIFDAWLKKFSSCVHLSKLDILLDGLQQWQGCHASIWCNRDSIASFTKDTKKEQDSSGKLHMGCHEVSQRWAWGTGEVSAISNSTDVSNFASLQQLLHGIFFDRSESAASEQQLADFASHAANQHSALQDSFQAAQQLSKVPISTCGAGRSAASDGECQRSGRG